jgi:glycine/D-amino acid oxidase-like deaminating enzyme
MTPERSDAEKDEASDYDVIVVGAGAGGMTTAAVAASRGLRVLLLEKSSLIGGTTAISGGMVWIPANSKMEEAELYDSRQAARVYLERTVGSISATLQAFLDHSDRAIRYLEDKTTVRFKPVMRYPDYYPDLPLAAACWSRLHSSLLGRHFALLRPPLPEFTLFGGMMLDRADIPHFRKAARSLHSTLRVARLLARHTWQRLAHPRGMSLMLGNALVARLLQSLLQFGVTIRTDTEIAALWVKHQSVSGVTVKTPQGMRAIRARHGVVLATGGLAHNRKLRQRYLPGAVTASATVWVPLSRFRRRNGVYAVYPHTVTDRAKPGLIAITRDGKRFTNEARSYHEFVRAMLLEQIGDTSNPAYLICDSRFLWRYGLGAIKPFTVFLRRHLNENYLYRGVTIGKLAAEIGIDPKTLETTVGQYNRFAVEGHDPEFGRGEDAYRRRCAQSVRAAGRAAAFLCDRGLCGRSRHSRGPCNGSRRPGPKPKRRTHRRTLCVWQRHGVRDGRRLSGPWHYDRSRADIRFSDWRAPGRAA